jgi:predicted ester cyclase
MVAERDKVVYRASARGTHKGEFMGIAPTGKEVTLTTIVRSFTPSQPALRRKASELGAVCRNSARTVLGGGLR